MAKGAYRLVQVTPFQQVTSLPRRYGVMFNPAASRSRLRITDSGRRYGVRLRDGRVEYSIDGDVTWRPIAPLRDPCTGETAPAFVSHNDSRAGRPLDAVSFDMIAVGRGRIVAKQAGTDRLFHLVMDELFRTRKVSCSDCDLDVDVGCRDQDPPVPGFYMKLDPEYFQIGPPSLVVPAEAKRSYAEHPASRRLPAFAELLRLQVAEVMLVMQRPRTWYEIDDRSPRSIVGPEDLRFGDDDLRTVLTEARLHQIVDEALRGWNDPIAKWLLGGEIDRLVSNTRAGILAEGIGGLALPAYVGLGLLIAQWRLAGGFKTEAGKLKVQLAALVGGMPPNKSLGEALDELMLRSRRRASAWPDSEPWMPTPNQPPRWMPTYEHTRYVPTRRFPRWEQLDGNAATVALAAGGALHQLHTTGAIWRYTGTPMTGWQQLDNNPAAKAITADGGNLYQLHTTGAIWRYTGTPMTGWQQLDNNPAAKAITADGGNLYQLHTTGAIWRYTGTPMTGWQQLDNNPAAKAITADGGNLYQLHTTGAIWRYTGTPMTGWQQLDNNPAAKAITADGGNLYQLHTTGAIWRYTGTPMTGWQQLDNNPQTRELAAAGGNVYQRQSTGAIFKFTGEPMTGWRQFDDNPGTKAIAADSGELYQLQLNGAVWRSTGPPEGHPEPDEPRYAIQYSTVLDLGVGYSHWSEQWLLHYGGEIHSLLARRPLLQGEQYNLIQYRFLNGPVVDGDAFNDGTTNFYMLVKLGPAGSSGSGLRQRYAILWIDEQTYFTQRWRLLDPVEDVLGDLFSLQHSLKDNPNWFNFDRRRFWSPFEHDLINDQSRMAVRRQIVAVTGFDSAAKRHEIYTICFNYGVCDQTWRWRPFPAGEQHVIEGTTAQDLDPPLPAVMTSGPKNAYVAVNTLGLRDDTTLHVRGTMRLAKGGPLTKGRWVQRYLPADCRHAPDAHRLIPGEPAPKPATGFSHPWTFFAEDAYRRADSFYQFGVYERDIDSRCQYYEIELLPGPNGAIPALRDVVARVWHNDAAVSTPPSPALDALHHTTTNFDWALTKDPNGAIVVNDQIRDRRHLPTMSMYEKTTRFRLLDRRPLGLIAVFYDKRDDELQASSDLPHETILEEDFENAAIPPEWSDEAGGEACGPTPIPRPPMRIRVLVKRNRRVLAPPNVRRAQVLIDRSKPQAALQVSFWTPQTEDEVSENIWIVVLAAVDDSGAVPIFRLRRAQHFIRRASPKGPPDYYGESALGDAWRYDCTWPFTPKLDPTIGRLCTTEGHARFGTSLWFENVVGHRSLPQRLTFG